jgi:hypothetical protein
MKIKNPATDQLNFLTNRGQEVNQKTVKERMKTVMKTLLK